MKSRLGLLSVLIAALLICTPPTIMLVGCATNKSEQSGYKTLYVIGSTANTAVDTWLKYYLLESYNTSKQPQSPETLARLTELKKQDDEVRKMYGDFQAAYNTALTAAQLDVSNPAPLDVIQLSVSLVTLISNFSNK